LQAGCNQFLAHATLADHQDRPIKRRHRREMTLHREKARRLADQVGKIVVHAAYMVILTKLNRRSSLESAKYTNMIEIPAASS
jgi:hypothetical protein